jgi:3-oxoacyl-[acyl-carrier-protein] synthase-3
MKSNRPIPRIVSTGSYLPKKVLSNADLENTVDTSDEWIWTRTGIRERRIAADDESTSDMGYEAGQRALEVGRIAPEEVDLIVVATSTPDYLLPSTASLLQAKLGTVHAVAFDIQAACSGYLYGLSIAKSFIESGQYSTILLVASEKLSAITDYQDRNTCVLFGDGAAACCIRSEGIGLSIRNIILGCDGRQADLLKVPGGGSRHPISQMTIDQRLHYITMEGSEVFKHAVRRMEAACKEALQTAGLEEDKLSWLIPHQANIRIIEALADRFGISRERIYITLHKYGNTSASSCGIALDEFLQTHQLSIDDSILLAAFGAGFTWGAGVITYAE